MNGRKFLVPAITGLALMLPAISMAGKGTIDATMMKVTIYSFAVSTNADCSDPIVVFSSADGVESDLLANPTYGSGPVDEGTYPCVMIEVSKIIHTSAKTSEGSCVAEQPFADVICQDGQASQQIDGTAVTCSGGADHAQHVTLFINTLSAGMGGDRALMPPSGPSDSTSGLKLTAPLVVKGDMPVTLTVDPKQFLSGMGPSCSTSAPNFGVD
jgi:hypothetical protein